MRCPANWRRPEPFDAVSRSFAGPQRRRVEVARPAAGEPIARRADLVSRRRSGASFCSCPRTKPISSYFLGKSAGRRFAVTVIGLGSNLIVRDGGVPGVVIRLGRGFSEIVIEGHNAARRRRGARRQSRARGAGSRHCRLVVHARHSRRHRRRAAHEWRRLWPRDQGCADRSARRRSAGPHSCLEQCRHALHLPALRRAGRFHLHASLFAGEPGDPAAIAAEMDKITEVARGDAADQKPHRRLDVQESARPQSLAADRRRRLPRACASATRRSRRCTAIS